ncbi:hypothetical protein KCP76_19620 [Salmonella enterica subsp. enterica serovar Weltevreden]|nr:hypothetical protein KCP76_19620 [Salmonella enterica subsp. enterica serovar Weltevreden]
MEAALNVASVRTDHPIATNICSITGGETDLFPRVPGRTMLADLVRVITV